MENLTILYGKILTISMGHFFHSYVEEPEGKPPFFIIFLWFSYGFPMVFLWFKQMVS